MAASKRIKAFAACIEKGWGVGAVLRSDHWRGPRRVDSLVGDKLHPTSGGFVELEWMMTNVNSSQRMVAVSTLPSDVRLESQCLPVIEPPDPRAARLRRVKLSKVVYKHKCSECGDVQVIDDYRHRMKCPNGCEVYSFSDRQVADDGEGYFHEWGVGYEEFETGPGNYTVAIVERDDGTVVEVSPQFVKFKVDNEEED